MGTTDFEIHEFALILRSLPERPLISEAFERADPQKTKRWWSSQREHMSEWFDAQDKLEFREYKRTKPNYSAKTTYAKLRHAEAIVWMAEALGVDTALVKEAADRSLALPRNKRYGFLRNNYFSWALIAQHATEAQARITRSSDS